MGPGPLNCSIFPEIHANSIGNNITVFHFRAAYRATSYIQSANQYSTITFCCPGYDGTVSQGCNRKCHNLCIIITLYSGICGNCKIDAGMSFTLSCATSFYLYNPPSAICTSECVHGTCTAPNVCTCDQGWRGEQCAEGKLVVK